MSGGWIDGRGRYLRARGWKASFGVRLCSMSIAPRIVRASAVYVGMFSRGKRGRTGAGRGTRAIARWATTHLKWLVVSTGRLCCRWMELCCRHASITCVRLNDLRSVKVVGTIRCLHKGQFCFSSVGGSHASAEGKRLSVIKSRMPSG